MTKKTVGIIKQKSYKVGVYFKSIVNKMILVKVNGCIIVFFQDQINRASRKLTDLWMNLSPFMENKKKIGQSITQTCKHSEQ